MRTLSATIISVAMLAGSAIGVAAQDEDETPTATYVTGTIVDSFGTPPESIPADGVDRVRLIDERQVEWSDPRLPSRLVRTTVLDARAGVHPEGPISPTVVAMRHRLEGPDGAWIGTGQGLDLHPFSGAEGSEDRLMSTGLLILTGEGDYEGLSAMLVLNVSWADAFAGTFTFEGYIFEGEPPPFPEPIEPGFSLSE